MQKKLLGRYGETVAADYLRRRKYKITGLNYSCRFGEVDIIAENRQFVAFVEVKLRKNSVHGEAREFVTEAKQKRIRSTALMWLSQNETKKQPRFDVIEIYAPSGAKTENPEIIHIQNAF